jgi:6-phosphofructokinase 2
LAALRLLIIEKLPHARFFVVSGSLPPGVGPEFLTELAEMAIKQKVPLIVDTSGAALRKVFETEVFLIKPNLAELCSLSGHPLVGVAEAEALALKVYQKGKTRNLLVSLGAQGAILVNEDGVKKFRAPIIQTKSTVGAGDSMVAGISWGLSRNMPVEEAVEWGIACGSAALMNTGTELFRREDVNAIFHSQQSLVRS